MLQRAGVRNEAYGDFVAILGAVTRAQIIELVEHSTAMREHRRLRHGTNVADDYEDKSQETKLARARSGTRRYGPPDNGIIGSTLQSHRSKHHISKSPSRQYQPGTRGDRAVQTLSIIGSMASVVSLAKEFLK
jgi:hypothetical protein